MDSCACGFETQSRVAGQPVSHFLTPPAQQASRCSLVKLGPSRVALVNAQQIYAIAPDVLLISFPYYIFLLFFSQLFPFPAKIPKGQGNAKGNNNHERR